MDTTLGRSCCCTSLDNTDSLTALWDGSSTGPCPNNSSLWIRLFPEGVESCSSCCCSSSAGDGSPTARDTGRFRYGNGMLGRRPVNTYCSGIHSTRSKSRFAVASKSDSTLPTFRWEYRNCLLSYCSGRCSAIIPSSVWCNSRTSQRPKL